MRSAVVEFVINIVINFSLCFWTDLYDRDIELIQCLLGSVEMMPATPPRRRITCSKRHIYISDRRLEPAHAVSMCLAHFQFQKFGAEHGS